MDKACETIVWVTLLVALTTLLCKVSHDHTKRTLAAFEHGYVENTVPGSDAPVWTTK